MLMYKLVLLKEKIAKPEVRSWPRSAPGQLAYWQLPHRPAELDYYIRRGGSGIRKQINNRLFGVVETSKEYSSLVGHDYIVSWRVCCLLSAGNLSVDVTFSYRATKYSERYRSIH